MANKRLSDRSTSYERFKRPEPSRSKRKAILIALEDEKSAKLYFQDWKEYLKASRVVVFARHLGPNPEEVVEAAFQADEERRVDRDRDEFDEVWIVVDTEGPADRKRSEQVRQAIEHVKKLGPRFHVAVSNPCFEYWLLLHFDNTTASFNDAAAVIVRLKKHVKNYKKHQSVFAETRDHVQTAIANAEKRFAVKGHGPHPCDCHPCTQIFALMKSLLGG